MPAWGCPSIVTDSWVSNSETDMKTVLTWRIKTENEVVGAALIALKHDELKEMGITSVGHRLTLLKSVYETKIKQDIPIDGDHYVPLCRISNFALS